MKSPIFWYGGKSYLAAKLIPLMPRHDCYVEPFAGSLAVLFAKPSAVSEIVNDLDGDVVNFFRVLRDPLQSERLIELLELTPYAREEYEDCLANHEAIIDPVEKARMFFVRIRMAMAGIIGNSWRTSISHHKAKSFVSAVAHIKLARERLREVQFECRPALRLIKEYCKNETVLGYLDPPYPQSTRTDKRNGYVCEMTESDHIELLTAIKESPAKIMLSSYPSELYSDMLGGWKSIEFEVVAASSLNSGKNDSRGRTEVIWFNPLAAAGSSAFHSIFN